MLAATAILLLFSTIGLACFVVWQRKQFSRRIAEIELRRLRAQINPHFLFFPAIRAARPPLARALRDA